VQHEEVNSQTEYITFLSYITLAIFHWLNYVSYSDILLVFIGLEKLWLSFHTKYNFRNCYRKV